ncbi:hypothetical protein FXO38_17933 [Capsicum annuum]|nr:hypothetical protein FXO38_17933 [Capsicum annuum]
MKLWPYFDELQAPLAIVPFPRSLSLLARRSLLSGNSSHYTTNRAAPSLLLFFVEKWVGFGQQNPLLQRSIIVEVAVLIVIARGEDLGDGDGISSIGENLDGYGGGVSAIGGDLGYTNVAARGENLGGCGNGISATGGDLNDDGVAARGENLGGGGDSAKSDDLGVVNGVSTTREELDVVDGDVSTTGEDLGDGSIATKSETLSGDSGSASSENLGSVSASIEQNLGDIAFVTATDVPIIPSNSKSETDVSKNSYYNDFFDEGENDEYGSDVHEEVRILRKQKGLPKKKRSDETKKEKKRALNKRC